MAGGSLRRRSNNPERCHSGRCPGIERRLAGGRPRVPDRKEFQFIPGEYAWRDLVCPGGLLRHMMSRWRPQRAFDDAIRLRFRLNRLRCATQPPRSGDRPRISVWLYAGAVLAGDFQRLGGARWRRREVSVRRRRCSSMRSMVFGSVMNETMRMYEAYCDQLPVQREVFRDLDEAWAWLTETVG